MHVYLDNAATTPMSPTVVEAMATCMRDHYGNPSSIHRVGRQSKVIIEQARKTIATEIKSSIGEIFFTSGGTESNNTAIKCAVRDLGVRRIISSMTEHHCVLHTVESLEKSGLVDVVYLDCDSQGRINMDRLADLLSASDTKTLVTLMHANNEIGTMINLEQVSQLCQDYDAYLHSDTIQTMAHFPLDVSATKIHFLSGSAHKFHGPKGIGFLYINGDIKINPFIEGGAQERNMRAGTENLYGIRGLEVAFKEACDEMDQRRDSILAVRSYLKNQLVAHFEDIQFMGDQENFLYTVLNVSFPSSSKSEMLLLNLDIEGIAASGGSACSSGADVGSHVLNAIGADPSRKSVRFSFCHHNTKEEIDFVIQKLKKIIPEHLQKEAQKKVSVLNT